MSKLSGVQPFCDTLKNSFQQPTHSAKSNNMLSKSISSQTLIC